MIDMPDDFDNDALALHVALSIKGWLLSRRNAFMPGSYHLWYFGTDWSAAEWTDDYHPKLPTKFRLCFWDIAGKHTPGCFYWDCVDHIEVLKLINAETPWIAAGNYPRGAHEIL